MLKEHKVALAEDADLQTITKRLEKEEQERHQQRVKEISSSAAEAQLFYGCLNDPEAGEAKIVVQAYIKAWAATYGVDLDAVRQRREETERITEEILANAKETATRKE